MFFINFPILAPFFYTRALQKLQVCRFLSFSTIPKVSPKTTYFFFEEGTTTQRNKPRCVEKKCRDANHSVVLENFAVAEKNQSPTEQCTTAHTTNAQNKSEAKQTTYKTKQNKTYKTTYKTTYKIKIE